ncbi:ABC transporter ATP-binding protein [Corticibacter populi]|uniref:ABC transporter ATP-binding protein n=1 Tax=Corticibacter populi TaxID=1550736 RepID=A0A3M6QV42_9BURK|nr:ABC transporter ATP-binding protein [Corticibacter populi]RMX06885.1 ABC transporter ATP-binding protein [Corticibacter populi]
MPGDRQNDRQSGLSDDAGAGAPDGTAALQAVDLTVCLGGQPVLQGVNVVFARGRWTSIVGPNGAGKSTLLKALAGLLPASGGQVWLAGQPLAAIGARTRAQQLAWLGQGERALDELTAYDTVMLGRMPHQGWLATTTREDECIVREAMQGTQTWAFRGRSLAELSGGERQRVLLARALAVRAPLLLMDEPLANLDPPHQTQWLLDMRALLARGVTLVSVLHEVSIALQADELLVLDAGRVLHHGESGDAATRAAVEAVFRHRIAVREVEGQWTAIPNLHSSIHSNVHSKT